MKTPDPFFEHDKLDAYLAAAEFVSFVHITVASFPRGRHALIDQFERACTSIALNIAEGAAEYSRREKARFYRMALRSASECAAILDVARRLGAISMEQERIGREQLGKIVAMLSGLVRSAET